MIGFAIFLEVFRRACGWVAKFFLVVIPLSFALSWLLEGGRLFEGGRESPKRLVCDPVLVGRGPLVELIRQPVAKVISRLLDCLLGESSSDGGDIHLNVRDT